MKLTKKQRCELHAKFAGHCAYCGVLLGDRWHADHMEAVWREPERVDGKYPVPSFWAAREPRHQQHDARVRAV